MGYDPAPTYVTWDSGSVCNEKNREKVKVAMKKVLEFAMQRLFIGSLLGITVPI